MLLIRPFPKIQETLPSYLLRLTEANGYRNPIQLLNTEPVQFTNNRLPSKKIFFGDFDIEHIATLANVDSSKLHNLKFLPYSSARCSAFGKIFSNKSFNYSNIRICPFCYQENRQFSFINLLMPKTYCTRHQLSLLTIHPETGKQLTWGTHYLWKLLNKLDSFPASHADSETEHKLNAVIEDTEHQAYILGTYHIDLPGLCDLLNFFARFHQVAFRSRRLDIAHCHANYCRQHYLPAYSYIEDWPNRYFELLNHFEKNPMGQQTGFTGVRKCFRDLYDDIYSLENQGSTGYQLLKFGFEAYLKNHFSLGTLSNSFTRLSKQTIDACRHMNESQVGQLLQIPPSRLKVLIREELLLPHSQLQNGQRLFTRFEVEQLKSRLADCLTLEACASLLDISAHKARQLLGAGLLIPLISTDEHNRDWLIEKHRVEDIILRLKCSAQKQVINANYDSNLKQFYFGNYSFKTLIAKMLGGAVEYNYEECKERPFSLRQFIPIFSNEDQSSSEYLSPNEASGVLGININAIYDLIKRGYLDVEMKSVNRTARPVKMIPVSSIQKFNAHFMFSGAGKKPHQDLKIAGPKLDGCCVNVYLNFR